MNIWVDADACPVIIRNILHKAAERTGIQITFVANQWLNLPPSKYLKFIQVAKGFDVADNEIVLRVQSNDLVISNDIPLAAEVIKKGASALNHRGERYTEQNIHDALSMRDLMETLRDSGLANSNQSAYSQSDKQNFANQLDRYLNAFLQQQGSKR